VIEKSAKIKNGEKIMKRALAQPVYFLSAQRTPFGGFLGSLSLISATDLGVCASKAALIAAGISPNLIDHVIFGNVLQTSKDAIYLARHIGLRCELSQAVPALTVNRLCGSGFEAIVQGARLIQTNEAHCVLVGGSENMSQAPHIIRGARLGISLGQGQLEDSLWESLNDSYVNMTMGMTAENLAVLYNISQEEVDEYSFVSQQRYQQALHKGAFAKEIIPIECGSRKNPKTLENDEHPRKDASLEALKKLPKVFKKDGVVHAGAASGICDGAGALILCSETFLSAHNKNPIGELIAFGVSGCDPKTMGLGPVNAIKLCLQKSACDLNEMELIEVNEAFAPQVLAVKKELRLDDKRLNVHGGAIAVGHPLAASGARITAHLLHNLSKDELGIGSACIGGGQGIAVLVKSL
jgi:acetyl-CoA acyltransferase 2